MGHSQSCRRIHQGRLLPLPSGGGGSIVLPLAINQGGTGGIDAASARSNLGVPASNLIGAINGIAPLDSSSLVPVINLPPYPTLSSLGAIPTSAIGTTVAPLVSGLVPVTNLPTYPTLASLGGIPLTQKGSASGVAALDANSLLSLSNIPLNTAFPFTAGASFRGGTSPGITPTLVQATVDSTGLPRYWLVNANAPVNSRIKSITVAKWLFG